MIEQHSTTDTQLSSDTTTRDSPVAESSQLPSASPSTLGHSEPSPTCNSDIESTTPRLSPEIPGPRAADLKIEDLSLNDGPSIVAHKDTTTTAVPGVSGAKPLFLASRFTTKGIKFPGDREFAQRLGRLTWDKMAEPPAEDVRTAAGDFRDNFFHPRLREEPYQPYVYPTDLDYSKGSSWVSVLKERGSRCEKSVRKALTESFRAFQEKHPEKSKAFAVEYVSNDVYAKAHPHPSIEDPHFNWTKEGNDQLPFNFDEFERKVDDFYADGVQKTKAFVPMVTTMKETAHFLPAAQRSSEEALKTDQTQTDGNTIGWNGTNVDRGSSSSGVGPLRPAKIELCARTVNLPGYEVSKDTEEKVSRFIEDLKKTFKKIGGSRTIAIGKDTEDVVTNCTQAAWETQNADMERAYQETAKLHSVSQSIFPFFSELVEYENFEPRVKVPVVDLNEFYPWLYRTKGIGEHRLQSSGEEVFVDHHNISTNA